MKSSKRIIIFNLIKKPNPIYEYKMSSLINSLSSLKPQDFDQLFSADRAFSSFKLQLQNHINERNEFIKDYKSQLQKETKSLLEKEIKSLLEKESKSLPEKEIESLLEKEIESLLEKESKSQRKKKINSKYESLFDSIKIQFTANNKLPSESMMRWFESFNLSEGKLNELKKAFNNIDVDIYERIIKRGGACDVLTNGENLIYSGVEYSPEDLQNELKKEITELNNSNEPVNKKTPKEKFDELNNKYWLIFLIFNLLWFIYFSIPEIAEKNEFWASVFSNQNTESPQIEETEKDKPVFPVGEAIPLRSEHNSKGKIQERLSRESRLNIISDVPHWYKVEYTAQNGNITTGWVAKRSVKSENKKSEVS
jgi:hypothetical protein